MNYKTNYMFSTHLYMHELKKKKSVGNWYSYLLADSKFYTQTMFYSKQPDWSLALWYIIIAH